MVYGIESPSRAQYSWIIFLVVDSSIRRGKGNKNYINFKRDRAIPSLLSLLPLSFWSVIPSLAYV